MEPAPASPHHPPSGAFGYSTKPDRLTPAFFGWRTHPSVGQGVGAVRTQAPFAVATDCEIPSSVHEETDVNPDSRPRGEPETGCTDPLPSHHEGVKLTSGLT